MPPKRTIESFITAASERRCQHIESETAANEGKVGGRVIKMLKGADKNGMSNFMYGYVGLCTAMYGSCTAMYGYVGLCTAM